MPRKNNSPSTRRRYEPAGKWADDDPPAARQREDHEAELVDPTHIGPYMRSLYLTACIGRPLLDNSLHDFTNEFPSALGRLNLRPLPGIVYVSGQELARKTNHGLSFGTSSRLSPSKCIEVAIVQLKATGVLLSAASEAVTLPVRQITAKKWGQAVQLQVEVSDVTEQLTNAYKVLGERTAVMNTYGLANATTVKKKITYLVILCPLLLFMLEGWITLESIWIHKKTAFLNLSPS